MAVKNDLFILWDETANIQGMGVKKLTAQNMDIYQKYVGSIFILYSKDICHLSSLLVNLGCPSSLAATLLMESVVNVIQSGHQVVCSLSCRI